MRILTYATLVLILIANLFLLQVVDGSYFNQITTALKGTSEASIADRPQLITTIKSTKVDAESASETSMNFSMADTITYVMPFLKVNEYVEQDLPDCEQIYRFNSDGEVVYKDNLNEKRNNVFVICPSTHGRRIVVTFSEFNLSAGDELIIYDGADTLASTPIIDRATGVGVSQINGGWLGSNCDPGINPTGCLTFNLKTNGDGNSGKGWRSIVNCLPDGLTSFENVRNISVSADCQTLEAAISLTVPALDVGNRGLCTIVNDSVIVDYCGFLDTLKAKEVINRTLPFGTYPVHFKLLADTSIQAHSFIYITTPGLVCNDTINAAIGQGCKTFLQPDDLLENFEACQAFDNGTIKQYYLVSVKTDTGTVHGTSTDPPVLNSKKRGNIVCNEFYDVYVTRVIETRNNDCIQSHRDSCTVTVKFIDGIKPIFVDVLNDTIAKIDTFYGCQDLQIQGNLLKRPTVFDNCEIASLEVEVPEIVLEACDTNKTFYAKWVATDQCGNTSFAYKRLLIKRPNETNLQVPRDTILTCSTIPTPSITGWPHLDTNGDGIPDLRLVSDGGASCFFDVTYKDDTIPDCGKAIQIIRKWSLRNFCKNEQSVKLAGSQVIQLKDTIAPIMLAVADGAIGSKTNPHIFPNLHLGCDGVAGPIPIPDGIDACDAKFDTKVVGLFYENGHLDKEFDLSQELPIGKYGVGFVHVDACKNYSDTSLVYFEIRDLTSPTAICTDELRVSMTSGNFPIRPEDINNGSADNCGIEQMFVRRSVCGDIDVFETTINTHILNQYNGQIPANGWADYIEVGCCDINQLVRLQLLAIDKAGNHNVCWLNVFPEDHLQPVCAILPDAVAYCDEYHTDEFGTQTDHNHNELFDVDEWLPVDAERATLFNEKFGNPVCEDNIECKEIIVEQEYQLILDLCGEQRIRRRYRSIDFHNNGNVSVWYEQQIHVLYRPGWSVTFPPDMTLQCGSVIPEADIQVSSGLCDLMKWEYKDEIFSGTGGGCYKVFRKWQLINNCQLVTGEGAYPLPRDINSEGRVTVDARRTFSPTDRVNGKDLNNFGYFTYTQIIKVIDSEAPIISISTDNECVIGGTSCTSLKTFTITAEDCTFNKDITFNYKLYEGGKLVESGTGATVDYEVSPYSTYTVVVEAYDNCGNSSTKEQLFGFKDCDPPIVLCNGNNLNIDLNSDKIATVPAAWLNGNSIDNCPSPLELKVWHKTVSNLPPAAYESVSLLPTEITFGCGDIGQSSVVLYAVDQANNFASCSMNITIQDLANYCINGRKAKISGTVATIAGDRVEGVEMHFSETDTEPVMQMTGLDGSFSFDVEQGGTYTITPKKDNHVLNGVSTFDLVLLQKHILEIEYLDSPYKYIAADINRSGTITAYDMVQMRQVILDILPTFPNNESWRFVNSEYSMNEDNPLEGFQENYRIWEVEEVVNIDFVAVKVGDVSGNAQTNALMAATPRSNKKPLRIQIQDQVLQAGQQYTIDFTTDQTDLIGYQFTLQHKELEFIQWNGGVVTADYFGSYKNEQGYLTVSWNQPPVAIGADFENSPIFSLDFEAKKDGKLSDLLQLSDRPTIAEAYNELSEVLEIELIFQAPKKQLFEVFQNRPNPFTKQTTVGFYLPTTSTVLFSVMDVTGKAVYQETKNYQQGEHEIILERNSLPKNGLFYYQVESTAGIITKTMIVID